MIHCLHIIFNILICFNSVSNLWHYQNGVHEDFLSKAKFWFSKNQKKSPNLTLQPALNPGSKPAIVLFLMGSVSRYFSKLAVNVLTASFWAALVRSDLTFLESQGLISRLYASPRPLRTQWLLFQRDRQYLSQKEMKIIYQWWNLLTKKGWFILNKSGKFDWLLLYFKSCADL